MHLEAVEPGSNIAVR